MIDYGLESCGSPTQRRPSAQDIQARAEELAAEALRNPETLYDFAVLEWQTDHDIWPALSNALRKCGEEVDDAIHSLRYIRLQLIRAVAPKFLEQARDEAHRYGKEEE